MPFSRPSLNPMALAIFIVFMSMRTSTVKCAFVLHFSLIFPHECFFSYPVRVNLRPKEDLPEIYRLCESAVVLICKLGLPANAFVEAFFWLRLWLKCDFFGAYFESFLTSSIVLMDLNSCSSLDRIKLNV